MWEKGGNGEYRTHDLKIMRLTLYRLSYVPRSIKRENREYEIKKGEHSRGRTCNPQIRSLMRFHCAICPYNYKRKNNKRRVTKVGMAAGGHKKEHLGVVHK